MDADILLSLVTVITIFIFLFWFNFSRTKSIAKIYLDPFLRYIQRPQWEYVWFWPKVSLTGSYQGRKVVLSYELGGKSAPNYFKIEASPLNTKCNPRRRSHIIFSHPEIVADETFREVDSKVKYAQEAFCWKTPRPVSDLQAQSLLSEMMKVIEGIEKRGKP